MLDQESISQAVRNFEMLVPIGFLVGGYGSMVGAGGGFLLVPILLLLMPGIPASTLTSMSLTVVFFAAYSGTVAYARMKRIHYFYGLLFAAAGIPGIVLGRVAVNLIPRGPFDLAFGIILLGLGIFLAVRPLKAPEASPDEDEVSAPKMLFASIGSAYVGLLSGLLGIGGGFIHVPLMIRALRLPAHVATATALFVLAIVAFVGNVSDAISGEFFKGLNQTMYLAVGVMMGAPLGAALSARMRGSLLIRLLALAICIVGVRLIWKVVA